MSNLSKGSLVIKQSGVYVEVNGYRVYQDCIVQRNAEMVFGAVRNGRDGLSKQFTIDAVRAAGGSDPQSDIEDAA